MRKSKLFTFILIFLSFSAIYSFYNFDSAYAYTGTITYNTGTNTIICVGGSSGTPITFNDLYLADVDGGWEQIAKQENQYSFNCKLQIGGGGIDTYFADYDKQIVFNSGCRKNYDENLISVSAAIVNIGYLNNQDLKISSKGCQFLDLEETYWGGFIRPDGDNSNREINIFSSTFNSITVDSFFEGMKVWHTLVLGKAQLFCNIYNTVSVDIFDITCTSNVGVRTFRTSANINQINSYTSAFSLWIGSNSGLIKNVKTSVQNGSYLLYVQDTGNNNHSLINVESNNWNLLFGGVNTGKVYRQYTFNLNVLNGNITDFVQNANVTLYKDGNKIYSAYTNSSGMIPTQTLTYGYYQQATGNTIQNATSPYYLVISHPDWQTYVSRFYITEPLRLTVSMQEPTITGYTEAEKSDYTTIILFVISLILCIIGLALSVPLLPLISLTVSVINVLFLTEISVFNILLIILNIIFTVITIVRTKTKNN